LTHPKRPLLLSLVVGLRLLRCLSSSLKRFLLLFLTSFFGFDSSLLL
jgi:hypothetical protein